MKKDWSGDKNSIFKTLGASSHSAGERQSEDFYATDPKAAAMLLEIEPFTHEIWEPACGMGHISEVLKNSGKRVRSTDLFDRGYGEGIIDFLAIDNLAWHADIITNPPYAYAQEFIEKALQIIPEGRKVAMFLKVQFLEGKARRNLFRAFPPKTVHVSSSRILCAKNGDFTANANTLGGGAVAYAWFIWEKGYKGTTELKWFN